MSDNGNNTPAPRHVHIDSFFGGVVVRCHCGSPQAIVLPVMNGAQIEGACPACGTLLRVDKLQWPVKDAQGNDGAAQIQVTGRPPTIARPTPNETAALNRLRPFKRM